MTRKEIYQQIKSNFLEEKIKTHFHGKNYTNIPTIELESFLQNYNKPEKVLSGMTDKQSNMQCNALIIDIIKGFVRKNPSMNFGDISHILGLNSIIKGNSSQAVLQGINASINIYYTNE